MKRAFLLLSLAFITTAMACNKEEGDKQPSGTTATSTTSQTQNTMKITIGNTVFNATLADTEAAKSFKAKLPLTLQMSDFGGFEKTANIGNLPRNDKHEASLSAGDLMLYGGSTLVLFYGNHGGYSYTRIGKIDNVAGLRAAMNSGTTTVKFEIE